MNKIKEKIWKECLSEPRDENTQKSKLVKLAINKTLEEVLRIIDEKIKKPYLMVGGTVEANHIFRKGRENAFEGLKFVLRRTR